MNKIDSILSKGIFLKSFGVNNWAFTKDEALNVLKELEDANTPILGGDVWVLQNEQMNHNYDNWYCERLSDESYSDYVRRSICKANNYINNYSQNKNIYFELLPLR